MSCDRHSAVGADAPEGTAEVPSAAAVGNALAVWAGPFWSGPAVCRKLGLAGQAALDGRRRGRTLLGVRTCDGVDVYPIWQFRRRGQTVDIRPEVARVLGILGGRDGWAVAVLLNTPAPELGGATPLGWVRAGGDADVLAGFARAVDAEWSR